MYQKQLQIYAMSEMKDASETFSSQDKDFLKLQKRVEHLQQENKVLQVRAQGVQVLGIVTLC